MRSLLAILVVVGAAGCEPARTAGSAAEARSALVEPAATARLGELGRAPLAGPEVFLQAPWGEEGFGRETLAAHTGPMAIAAEADGGLAVLDTVGGRLRRFDAAGRELAVVPLGTRTADDLAVLPAGGFAVLAYERLPEPHHAVLVFSAEGEPVRSSPAPQAATLPTALVADGELLLVEQRHEALHPLDGSARLWGRPAGELLVRASLDPDRQLVLAARDRQGQMRWQRRLVAPWPVTEVLALEVSDPLLAVVVRRVDDSGADEDGPAEQQTWLVVVDRAGEPRGELRLRDERVTDSGRPFALSRSGDFFELVTTEDGVTVLRYRLDGGAR